MKSKTSFFSKGLFISNLRRFWPLMLIVLFVQMSTFPMNLYMSWYNSRNYYETNPEELKYFLASQLTWRINADIVVIYGIIAMLLIFGYLYAGRTAYMMSSFPVSRKACYITGILSVITLLTVPLIISTLCSYIICVCIGTSFTYYLMFYFWVQFAALILATGMGALSVFLAGNRLGAIGVYTVLNIIANAALNLYYMVMKVCYLGYSSNQEISVFDVVLCPMFYISNKVSVVLNYDWNGQVTSHHTQGGLVMLGYLAAGLVMMILGWIAYRCRRMETAGDLISFGWVKILLQIIVCAVGSVFVGALVSDGFLGSFAITRGQSFVLMFLIAIVLGAIGFYAFEMISQRTFRVFAKKVGITCAIYSAVVAAALVVIKADPTGYVESIPAESEIAWAGMSSSYSFIYGTNGPKKSEIVDYHKMLLENRNVLENLIDTDNTETDYIQIKYILKDGTKIWRNYSIINKDDAMPIIDKTADFYNDPEKILEGLIAKNWQEFDVKTACYMKTVKSTEPDQEYGTEYVDVKDKVDLEKLYKAVIADIRAGHYNAYDLSGYERYANSIDFTLESSKKIESNSDNFYDYEDDNVVYDNTNPVYSLYFSINLCEEMTETIKVLKETGLIESEDDLKYGWQIYGDGEDPMDVPRDATMMY